MGPALGRRRYDGRIMKTETWARSWSVMCLRIAYDCAGGDVELDLAAPKLGLSRSWRGPAANLRGPENAIPLISCTVNVGQLKCRPSVASPRTRACLHVPVLGRSFLGHKQLHLVMQQILGGRRRAPGNHWVAEVVHLEQSHVLSCCRFPRFPDDSAIVGVSQLERLCAVTLRYQRTPPWQQRRDAKERSGREASWRFLDQPHGRPKLSETFKCRCPTA